MNERKAPTAVASFYIDADCHWIIALEVYIIAILVKTHLASLTQNTVGPISTTFHCRRLSKENWRGQVFIMLLLNAKMEHSAFFYQTAGNQVKWETKIQNKKCSRSTLIDQWILAGMSEVHALFLGFVTEYLSGLQQTLQGPSLWSFLASLPRPVCLPSALLITAHFHLCLIQHCAMYMLRTAQCSAVNFLSGSPFRPCCFSIKNHHLSTSLRVCDISQSPQ